MRCKQHIYRHVQCQHTNDGEVLKWSKRRDSKSRRTLTRCVGSNPTFSAKKEVTFVYQKLLLFLSIAKAMAYHHALACISSPQAYIINRRLYRFRNDDIQNFVLMIYRNKLRMLYNASSRFIYQSVIKYTH